jgi:hypothetical protein
VYYSIIKFFIKVEINPIIFVVPNMREVIS